MKQLLLKMITCATVVVLSVGCNVMDNGATESPWVSATIAVKSRVLPKGLHASVIDPKGAAILCAVPVAMANFELVNLKQAYSCAMLDLATKSARMKIPATQVRFVKLTYNKPRTKAQIIASPNSSTSNGLSIPYMITTALTSLLVNIDGDGAAFNFAKGDHFKGVNQFTMYTESPLDEVYYGWDGNQNLTLGSASTGGLVVAKAIRPHVSVAAGGRSLTQLYTQWDGTVSLTSTGQVGSFIGQGAAFFPSFSADPFSKINLGFRGVLKNQSTVVHADTGVLRPVPILKEELIFLKGSGAVITTRPIYIDKLGSGGTGNTHIYLSRSTTWDVSAIPTRTSIFTDGVNQFWKSVTTGAADPNGGYYEKTYAVSANTAAKGATPVWALLYTKEKLITETLAAGVSTRKTRARCLDSTGKLAYLGAAVTSTVFAQSIVLHIVRSEYIGTCVVGWAPPIIDRAQTTLTACQAAYPAGSSQSGTFFTGECAVASQIAEQVDTEVRSGTTSTFTSSAALLSGKVVSVSKYITNYTNGLKQVVKNNSLNYYQADQITLLAVDSTTDVYRKTYTPQGRLATEVHSKYQTGGVKKDVLFKTYTYNAAGRVTQLDQKNLDPLAAYNVRSIFTFDALGRYASIKTYDLAKGAPSAATQTCASFNSFNPINLNRGNGQWTYGTSAAGNRTVTTDNFCSNTTTPQTVPAFKQIVTYNSSGQILTIVNKVVNLASTVTKSFTYAGLKLTQASSSGAVLKIDKYTYDINDFVQTKTSSSGGVPALNFSFAYDAAGTLTPFNVKTVYTYK